MFIEVTNFESGATTLINPADFMFVAPLTRFLATKGNPNVVMMIPNVNPTMGIPLKEDYETIKALIEEGGENVARKLSTH